MSRAGDVLKKMHNLGFPNLGVRSIQAVKDAFAGKLAEFDFDGVVVKGVDPLGDGDIVVTFEDYEGDVSSVLFGMDPVEGPFAMIVGDEMDEEHIIVDLGTVEPTINRDGFVETIELADLTWMNKSTLSTILQAGDIDGIPDSETGEIEECYVAVFDDEIVFIESGTDKIKFGDDVYEIDERFKTVVRGGKKVKLTLVKRKKRRHLTAKQKAGIRKGVAKRKSKKSQISRALKKSLKVRKGSKLGKQKTPKGYKVTGA